AAASLTVTDRFAVRPVASLTRTTSVSVATTGRWFGIAGMRAVAWPAEQATVAIGYSADVALCGARNVQVVALRTRISTVIGAPPAGGGTPFAALVCSETIAGRGGPAAAAWATARATAATAASENG